MKQGAAGVPRQTPGARVRVIRGGDACAVARAVRETVEDGIVLPAGPYRYPYAAVSALLRIAGSFVDPPGETTTDPVLSREPLVDGLRKLLARGNVISVTLADKLDAASAELLGRYAATAHLAVEHGLQPGGLVLGTLGELPSAFRFDSADIRDVEPQNAPKPKLSDDARHVLRLVAGAPHPVRQNILRAASGLAAAYLQTALVELAAGDLIEVGERIGLGPAAESGEACPEWQGTPEVFLPAAALSISGDPRLARQLGHAALQRGEFNTGVYCFGFTKSERVSDAIAYGRALAGTGKVEPAKAIFDELAKQDLPEVESTALGALGVLLAERGALKPQGADRVLKRFNNVTSRGWRIRLKVWQGQYDSARNLVRRTTREELEYAQPAVRLEHQLAIIAALRHSGQEAKVEKKLREAEELCTTRAERRRLGVDTARLAALDLDAPFLRDCGGAEVLKELLATSPGPEIRAHTPKEMFANLRVHGATLLAALEGESLVVVPPGALARPGLAAHVGSKLRRMREYPEAFSFGSDEFESLGPFAGRSTLALQRSGGPMFVLFRRGHVPDVAQLIKDMNGA